MRMFGRCIIVILCLFGTSAPLAADEVYLVNGDRITGKVKTVLEGKLTIESELAGTVNIDLVNDPLGTDSDGQPVYLKDLMPDEQEVQALMAAIQPELYQQIYADLFSGDENWQSVTPGKPSALFPWDPNSTYIKEPPYFKDFQLRDDLPTLEDIQGQT